MHDALSVTGIGPNVDLIWCNDFATALALRQHVRKQDILSRDVSSIAVSGMATVEELPEDDSKNAADKTDENKPILL